MLKIGGQENEREKNGKKETILIVKKSEKPSVISSEEEARRSVNNKALISVGGEDYQCKEIVQARTDKELVNEIRTRLLLTLSHMIDSLESDDTKGVKNLTDSFAKVYQTMDESQEQALDGMARILKGLTGESFLRLK